MLFCFYSRLLFLRCAGFPYATGMDGSGSFASHDGFSHAGICSGRKINHFSLQVLSSFFCVCVVVVVPFWWGSALFKSTTTTSSSLCAPFPTIQTDGYRYRLYGTIFSFSFFPFPPQSLKNYTHTVWER